MRCWMEVTQIYLFFSLRYGSLNRQFELGSQECCSTLAVRSGRQGSQYNMEIQ